MTYVPTKDIKIKERQDKFLKAQLEKEREQALLEEIEKTEKERVKKKGTVTRILVYNSIFKLFPTHRLLTPLSPQFTIDNRFESAEVQWHP